MSLLNKYQGCFLGLVIGDAYGAQFEGRMLERMLWLVLNKISAHKLRYTDDSQMSIDIANLFLLDHLLPQDSLAIEFSENYKWSRGYGPGAARILKKIKAGRNWQDVNRLQYKEGSLGNGAAMRAPIIALCFPQEEKLYKKVSQVSEITHAHPLAIDGAYLIAYSTLCALHDKDSLVLLDELMVLSKSEIYYNKLKICNEILLSELNQISNTEIRKIFGNGMTATESCVTSIFFAIKYRDKKLMTMINRICELGGDTDTIAAMAGAIWGAFNGINAINVDQYERVEGISTVRDLAKSLYKKSIMGQ